jgi:hypothetical protein
MLMSDISLNFGSLKFFKVSSVSLLVIIIRASLSAIPDGIVLL